VREQQLGRMGRNGRDWLAGKWDRGAWAPVPCGTPFSAILRRFTQVSPKPWPVGHRPADSLGGLEAPGETAYGDIAAWEVNKADRINTADRMKKADRMNGADRRSGAVRGLQGAAGCNWGEPADRGINAAKGP